MMQILQVGKSINQIYNILTEVYSIYTNSNHKIIVILIITIFAFLNY